MLAADALDRPAARQELQVHGSSTDPKDATGFQNIAPIVKTSLANQLGSKFATTVNAVSKTLTLNAIVAMNKAVEVDKQSAASVASAFLKANHLK